MKNYLQKRNYARDPFFDAFDDFFKPVFYDDRETSMRTDIKETDNGYPSMESFKLLAKLFHTTIDELISDEDIENKKHLEDKIARNFFWGVLASFLVALGFAIATWVTDIPYFIIGSFVGVLAYWVFAYFATPRYKRLEAKKDGTFTKHLIIRLVILALLIVIIITTAIQTF